MFGDDVAVRLVQVVDAAVGALLRQRRVRLGRAEQQRSVPGVQRLLQAAGEGGGRLDLPRFFKEDTYCILYTDSCRPAVNIVLCNFPACTNRTATVGDSRQQLTIPRNTRVPWSKEHGLSLRGGVGLIANTCNYHNYHVSTQGRHPGMDRRPATPAG